LMTLERLARQKDSSLFAERNFCWTFLLHHRRSRGTTKSVTETSLTH